MCKIGNYAGADPGFPVGGALKIMVKIVGVFRVTNNDLKQRKSNFFQF